MRLHCRVERSENFFFFFLSFVVHSLFQTRIVCRGMKENQPRPTRCNHQMHCMRLTEEYFFFYFISFDGWKQNKRSFRNSLVQESNKLSLHNSLLFFLYSFLFSFLFPFIDDVVLLVRCAWRKKKNLFSFDNLKLVLDIVSNEHQLRSILFNAKNFCSFFIGI